MVCFSEQNNLNQLEDAAKSAKKGKWSDEGKVWNLYFCVKCKFRFKERCNSIIFYSCGSYLAFLIKKIFVYCFGKLE